jgi:hypothetical protein
MISIASFLDTNFQHISNEMMTSAEGCREAANFGRRADGNADKLLLWSMGTAKLQHAVYHGRHTAPRRQLRARLPGHMGTAMGARARVIPARAFFQKRGRAH